MTAATWVITAPPKTFEFMVIRHRVLRLSKLVLFQDNGFQRLTVSMAACRHEISATPPILAVFARRKATRLSSTHSLRDPNRTRGYDTCLLPGKPAKQIHVDWTRSDAVRWAQGATGDKGYIFRGSSAKAERVMSALVCQTDEFPPAP